MKIYNYKDMKGGWFVGNFEPTAHKTENFEVSYKIHPKGEIWDHHYHKVVTEINYLVTGRMRIQNTELTSGDIFVIEPNEVADPIFYEDCHIVCVKTASVKGDKYILERKNE
jgi:quercetin dioxygenase-like cupin family protein